MGGYNKTFNHRIDVDLSCLPDLLVDVIEELNGYLATIPEGSRPAAKLSTDEDYDAGFSRYATITWTTTETNAERAEREMRESLEREKARINAEERKRANAEAAERRDQMEFFRLKAKYDPSRTGATTANQESPALPSNAEPMCGAK